MEMPQPTDAHRKLHKLAGAWKGEETMHPSPWDPQGNVSEAAIDNRVGLDGLIVVGDYEQSREGTVTFRGHSVFTYDGTQEDYALYWFDSMGMPPNVFHGGFEGDVLTATCVDAQGQTRLTYDFSVDGQLRSRMEMSQDGQEWNVLMEGSYQRQD